MSQREDPRGKRELDTSDGSIKKQKLEAESKAHRNGSPSVPVDSDDEEARDLSTRPYYADPSSPPFYVDGSDSDAESNEGEQQLVGHEHGSSEEDEEDDDFDEEDDGPVEVDGDYVGSDYEEGDNKHRSQDDEEDDAADSNATAGKKSGEQSKQKNGRAAGKNVRAADECREGEDRGPSDNEETVDNTDFFKKTVDSSEE